MDRTSAAAGDLIEIRGQGFGDNCNDIDVNGTFAGPPLGNPLKGIKLLISQDAQVIPLGSVDADAAYNFGVRLAVPAELQVGTATVRVEHEPQARYSGALATFTVTSAGASAIAGPTTTVLLKSAASVTESVPTETSSTPAAATNADGATTASAPVATTSPGQLVSQAPLTSTRSYSPARDLRFVALGVVVFMAAVVLLLRRRRTARHVDRWPGSSHVEPKQPDGHG